MTLPPVNLISFRKKPRQCLDWTWHRCSFPVPSYFRNFYHLPSNYTSKQVSRCWKSFYYLNDSPSALLSPPGYYGQTKQDGKYDDKNCKDSTFLNKMERWFVKVCHYGFQINYPFIQSMYMIFFHPSWISAIGAEKKYSIDREIDGNCWVHIWNVSRCVP